MDQRDKELLNEIQAGFPVEPHPYRVLGERLRMDEEEVIARIAKLRQTGIIRRLGASIDRRVGFVSTLLAAKVPKEKLRQSSRSSIHAPASTHNYERKHEYNVWFTLIAPSVKEKE